MQWIKGASLIKKGCELKFYQLNLYLASVFRRLSSILRDILHRRVLQRIVLLLPCGEVRHEQTELYNKKNESGIDVADLNTGICIMYTENIDNMIMSVKIVNNINI